MKLNLGCGADVRQGWENLDYNPNVCKRRGVKRCDVFKKLPYPDGSVSEIHARYVLEYGSYHRTPQVIEEWLRVLEPGGTITIAVPDFEAIARDYVSGRMAYLTAVIMLFGTQQHWQDCRKTAIDWAMIVGQLNHWGCEGIERLPGKTYELIVQARKKGG